MTFATIEITDELIGALGAELRDHARGFACRADSVQDSSRNSFGFGDLWKGKDYAWRTLLNPSFQLEVMLALGNCDDQEVAAERSDMVCSILAALSESMPDDAMIDLMVDGESAAEVISGNLLARFAKAKAASRMVEICS